MLAVYPSFHKHKELLKYSVLHVPVPTFSKHGVKFKKKKSLLKGVALHFCINLSGLKETTQYSVSLSDSK